MSDKEDLARSIVLAAIAAAGPGSGAPTSWRHRVDDMIPQVAAMLGESSWQMRGAMEMLDAAVIVTHVHHVEFEESSQRWVIWFANEDGSPQMSNGRKPEPEKIRSDRVDGPGKRLAGTIERLQAGDRIVIWKVMQRSNKEGDDTKFRVARHLEVTKRSDSDQPAPSQRASAPRRQEEEEPPPPPPPDVPERSDSDPMGQVEYNRLRKNAEAKLGPQGWRDALDELEIRQIDIFKTPLSKREWRETVAPVLREVAEAQEVTG